MKRRCGAWSLRGVAAHTLCSSYLLAGVILVFFPLLSGAHSLSTAYLRGGVDGEGVLRGEWQLRLYDLHRTLGLDANEDGQLLWGELRARSDAVQRYLAEQWRTTRGGQPCALWVDPDWQVTERSGEGYLIVPLRADCAGAGDLMLNYEAFFATDTAHKLLVNLRVGEADFSGVITAEQRYLQIDAGANVWRTGLEFGRQGVIHIWLGFDHLLFLMTLLSCGVLSRVRGRWAPQGDMSRAVGATVWTVTAFTLAHSITLIATGLGWLMVPGQWVEVGIAASAIIAALNNIVPVVSRVGFLAFGFGLLHGMGFAGALGELGMPAGQRVFALFAFNIGVEVGQLAIVLLILPVLLALRKKPWYPRLGLPLASAIFAAVASYWMWLRI